MKLKLIYTLLIFAFLGIIFQSNSSGPAFAGNGDRTGSPISSGTCASCHSGGSFGTTYLITVKDGIGNTVTSYTPGGSYFVEFRVSSTSGTRYGSQGVAITSSNAQAGNFGTPTSTNTRRTTFGGRQYIEHNGFATGSGSFTFRAPWTAPAAGTGNVRIYGVGMTVNGTGSTAGDQASSSTMITLTETPFATINYTNTNYCANATDPTPTISGTQGGSFSATPSGLVINSSTGAVDLSASTPGQTYTVTYTYGGGLTTTDVFLLTAADNAAFSYTAGSSFCKTETDPSPTITGLTGGTFSSTAGLSINPSTGAIDLSASQSGSYTVIYTTNGSCPNSSGVPITILPMDNAQFTLGGNTFCQDGADRTPTGGVTPGGTWTGSAGLVVNSSTGMIDVSASTLGNHSITYITNGTCPDTNTVSLTIVATDDASFTVSDTAFCQDGVDGSVTITGTSGGSFSGSAGLSVNPSSGAIDVSASSLGNHIITYITNGFCRDTMSQTVAIYNGNAQFTYGNNTFCQNANNPVPMGGSTGGWWTGTSGLVVDSLTGVINLSASMVGNHVVSHVLGGFCPDSVGMPITVVEVDSAEFDFVDTTFCLGTPNAILSVTGTTTGIYSTSSGLIFIDNTTGEIDLTNSNSGTYVLTYTSNGACPVTVNTTVYLSICGGISQLADDSYYKLYPNPSQGAFSIKNTKSEEDLVIKIVDIWGRVVFSKNYFIAQNSAEWIEVPSLSKGTYFVQIIGKEKSETIKMDIK